MNRAHLILGAGAALVLVGVVGWLAARRAGILPDADTFNPLSRKNVFARGADALVSTLTDGRHQGLGPAVYETFNREPDLTASVQVAPLSGYWGLFSRSYYLPWLAAEEQRAAELNRVSAPKNAAGDLWIVG